MLREESIKKIDEFLKYLGGVISVYDLYPVGHPVIRAKAEKAYVALRDIFKEMRDVNLILVGEDMVFENVILEASSSLTKLIRGLSSCGIERFSFSDGLSEKELIELAGLLAKGKGFEELAEEIKERGLFHISIGKIGVRRAKESDSKRVELKGQPLYNEGVEVITDVIDEVRQKGTIRVTDSHLFIEKVVNSILWDKAPLITLTLLKREHDYAFTHGINVAILSIVQAENLGLDKKVLIDIGSAAFFHDLGKVMIEERLLNKSGTLEDEELEVMQHHPIEGARILEKSPGVGSLAPVVAFEHHLRYNLTGYPKLRRKRPLNTASLIVAISDVYDALRTNRPYREGFTSDVTAKLMLSSTGHFEERLLAHFFSIVGVYSIGSLVRLKSGEVGLVIEENHLDLLRPKSKIILDKDGQRLDQPEIIDTSTQDDYIIMEVLDPDKMGIDPKVYLGEESETYCV